MFITDWPMSLKQRLPGSDESRRGKVERSGVKDVVVRLNCLVKDLSVCE